jgi:hypothetical protein
MNPYASPESESSLEKAPRSWGRKLLLAVVALSLFPFLGYRPGSRGLNDVIVKGRITTAEGSPLADEPVDLLLPATYGLSASEAGHPADFGNSNHLVQVSTDANGQFSHSFGPVAYHVDHFWVPFHISIPAGPPPLYFYLRLPRLSPDRYLIDARENSYELLPEEEEETPASSASDFSISVREELDATASITAFVELRHNP